MSEKRHQQQQRRQRRKATGRARSTVGGRGRADRELAGLLAHMAVICACDVGELTDALEAEEWASALIGTWHVRPMPGEDVEAMFFPGFVDAVEQLGTPQALATLRALAAV